MRWSKGGSFFVNVVYTASCTARFFNYVGRVVLVMCFIRYTFSTTIMKDSKWITP